MTADKLRQTLIYVTAESTKEIMDGVANSHNNGLSYRRSVNSYFNNRLISLDVPLHIRDQLIPDGSDGEWCDRFVNHVLPLVTKEVI